VRFESALTDEGANCSFGTNWGDTVSGTSLLLELELYANCTAIRIEVNYFLT
jgi:hypothetical protein